jgi:hypothetical protein
MVGRKGQVQYKPDSWYGWQKRPGTVQVRQLVWLAEMPSTVQARQLVIWQRGPGTVQARQLVWLAEKARYSTSQTASMVGRKGQVQYKPDSWYGWQKRPGTVQVRQLVWLAEMPGTVQVRQLVGLAEKARYSTSQTAGMAGREDQI